MRKKGTLLFGLLLLISLWLLMLFFNWHRIEKEIETASSAALDQAGYIGLEVDTAHRGRTVNLSGVLRSEESINQVVTLVNQVEGVHRVTTDHIELKPYLPASVSITSRGKAMTLLGEMSSDAAAVQFSRQIEKSLGMSLDHGISIDSDVESPQWLVGLATAMPSISAVENLQLNIQNRVLKISGTSRDEAEHNRALNAVQNLPGIRAVDSSGLKFKMREPAWFVLSGGVLSGTTGSVAESLELKQRLDGLTALKGENQVAVDAEFAPAEWLGDLGKIVSNIGGVELPEISFRDGVMRVSGVVRTKEAFDALANQAPALTHTKQLNLAEVVLRPLEPAWMHLQVSEEKMVLQGMVRDENIANQLLNQLVGASSAGFNGTIENLLKPSVDSSPAEWATDMSELIAGMAAVEKGALSLRDGVLTLSGLVREESTFNQLRADSVANNVADTVDTSQLAFRPWKAPKFAISVFDLQAVVSGRVSSEKEATLLGEAVNLVFGSNGSTQILVDSDVTDVTWLNDVMRLMPAMTGLENASLTAIDAELDLEGVARSQESYELVAKAVDESTAQSIRNNVSLRPWQQPSLEILVSGNLLRGSGSLPDEEAVRNINLQLAEIAATKNIVVESKLEVGADVQNSRWLALVIQVLPSLSALDDPGLQIANGVVTVSGLTKDEAVRDLVVSSLSDIANNLSLQNNIVFVPPLVVQTGAGSVGVAQEEIDRCEENLDAEMAQRSIEFASSSAVLSASSTPVLISLVTQLRDCPDVLIEVSGHTDSTGDSASNLALSDQRARAVVDYLLIAGIPETRLQAKGYGSERPIADNETLDGRAANRRIEFNIKIKR